MKQFLMKWTVTLRRGEVGYTSQYTLNQPAWGLVLVSFSVCFFFLLSIMFSSSLVGCYKKNILDIFVHVTIFQHFIDQTLNWGLLRKAASSPWALALTARVFFFLALVTGRKHDTWKLSELDSESSLSSSGMKPETLIPRISESGELQIPYHLH